ncbi:hypothetical protein [Aquamicrobium sp. LC103]|uniref:hypothetical protein n=1 Tax=Aquamicrobium sp. LC103 TaxID=1120658 RepID=UPI00063E85CD|nr:hypothetical protein [Aquamicrobium sp. LC103]TKT79155.1 hypothetical protein XW59_009490 [Aquamicrobium sp. LC103]
MPYKRHDIDRLAQKQTDDYLRRSSLTYLECCISLMLTHISAEQTARILETEARMIRELG